VGEQTESFAKNAPGKRSKKLAGRPSDETAGRPRKNAGEKLEIESLVVAGTLRTTDGQSAAIAFL
jgi:hypothetical protein